MCPLGKAVNAGADRESPRRQGRGVDGLIGAVAGEGCGCALHGPAHQTSAGATAVAGGDVKSAYGGRRGVDVGGVDFIPTITGIAKPARAVVAAYLCRNKLPLLGVGNSTGEGVGHLGEELGRLAVGGAVGHAKADATHAEVGRGAAGSHHGFVGTGGAENFRENTVAGMRRLSARSKTSNRTTADAMPVMYSVPRCRVGNILRNGLATAISRNTIANIGAMRWTVGSARCASNSDNRAPSP